QPPAHLDQPRIAKLLVDLAHGHRGDAEFRGELAHGLKLRAVGDVGMGEIIAEQPVELRAHRYWERLVYGGRVDREHVYYSSDTPTLAVVPADAIREDCSAMPAQFSFEIKEVSEVEGALLALSRRDISAKNNGAIRSGTDQSGTC